MKLQGMYADLWDLVNITNKKDRLQEFKIWMKYNKGDEE